MLVVPTQIRPSSIHGSGVFLLVPVKKGDLIWRFDSRIDRVYSQSEIDSLPELAAKFITHHAELHRTTGVWILSGDNARYINHSDSPATLSMGIGFADDLAARDLEIGAELTSDYRTTNDKTWPPPEYAI